MYHTVMEMPNPLLSILNIFKEFYKCINVQYKCINIFKGWTCKVFGLSREMNFFD